MLTDLQKKTAQAIVNIFETGSPHGEYGSVTLLAGDTGHLTYGRSQTTLASGNLFLLIKAYCDLPEAHGAAALTAYLPRLASRDITLDHDLQLHRLLREAGEDPVMRSCQDDFFDRVYWSPAKRGAELIGVHSPLGVAVVYDSHIHGSWRRIRDRTIERHGRVADSNEQAWIDNYVNVRRDWLGGHSNRLLQRTVYRMDSFRALMHTSKWDLPLPLIVRGLHLDEETLAGPAIRISADDENERLLRLQDPWMVGDDVLEVQRALETLGYPVPTDGIYGPPTEAAVRRFQQIKGLTPDGVVGPATRSTLEL